MAAYRLPADASVSSMQGSRRIYVGTCTLPQNRLFEMDDTSLDSLIAWRPTLCAAALIPQSLDRLKDRHTNRFVERATTRSTHQRYKPFNVASAIWISPTFCSIDGAGADHALKTDHLI